MNKKAIGIIILTLFFASSITGCNSKKTQEETEESTSVSNVLNDTLDQDDEAEEEEDDTWSPAVTNEDITWETWIEEDDSGDSSVLFSYTNESEYTLTTVEVKFELKSSVTYEDLINAFDEELETDWMDLSEDDLYDFYLIVYCNDVVEPAQSSNASPMYISDWLSVRNISQMNLYEATQIGITYIDEDKLYSVAFDLTSGEFYYEESTDYDGEVAYTETQVWGTSELSSLIPALEGTIVGVEVDQDSYFSAYCYGVDEEYYSRYVQECIEMGFSDIDYQIDGMFKVYHESGEYHLLVCYDENNGEVQVYLQPVDEVVYSGISSNVLLSDGYD